MTQFGCAAERVFRDHDQPPFTEAVAIAPDQAVVRKENRKKTCDKFGICCLSATFHSQKRKAGFLKIQSENPLFSGTILNVSRL